METAPIPPYQAYLWPIVETLRQRGGSMTIEEMVDDVSSYMGLTPDQLEVPHGTSGRSKVDYRMAWARTYLKKAGVLENSERGVWSLTSTGASVQKPAVDGIPRQVHQALAQERRARGAGAGGHVEVDPDQDELDESLSWVEQLLQALQGMPPAAFERLCQRLLRESGFTKVEVTGKSGDGGIDGTGVLRLNLLSFHVLFQCKRYTGTVGAGAVRDFRGAMVGRADKGLIITTGTFSADARREAVRDGAPAIDLIDGAALCELMRDLKIGLKVRLVEEIEVDQAAIDGF